MVVLRILLKGVGGYAEKWLYIEATGGALKCVKEVQDCPQLCKA